MLQLFSVKLPSVGQMWRTGIQPKRQPEMHRLVCIFDVLGSPRTVDSQLLETVGTLVVAYHGRQKFFIDLGNDYVVGVDHFVQMDFGGFGEQLVGVHFG